MSILNHSIIIQSNIVLRIVQCQDLTFLKMKQARPTQRKVAKIALATCENDRH